MRPIQSVPLSLFLLSVDQKIADVLSVINLKERCPSPMADAAAVDEPSRDGALHTETPPRPKSSKDIPMVQEHGVTVLWEPKQGSATLADVIFVHGLGGHPRKTWQYGKAEKSATEETAGAAQERSRWNTSMNRFKTKKSSKSAEDKTPFAPGPSGPLEAPKSESQSQGCFWPYDLVPDDFGNLRILTYGYDSHPSHFYTGRTVQMNISQHSQQLLQSITDFRRECKGRPIIFVVHSLGGILVKDAIILSGKYGHQPAMKDVSLSCKAILFFRNASPGCERRSLWRDACQSCWGSTTVSQRVQRGTAGP